MHLSSSLLTFLLLLFLGLLGVEGGRGWGGHKIRAQRIILPTPPNICCYWLWWWTINSRIPIRRLYYNLLLQSPPTSTSSSPRVTLLWWFPLLEHSSPPHLFVHHQWVCEWGVFSRQGTLYKHQNLAVFGDINFWQHRFLQGKWPHPLKHLQKIIGFGDGFPNTFGPCHSDFVQTGNMPPLYFVGLLLLGDIKKTNFIF